MTRTPPRRGRPPLDREDPSEHLHVRLPSKQYAATVSEAERARMTQAEWIRYVVRKALNRRDA
jgi:hypothetical protein